MKFNYILGLFALAFVVFSCNDEFDLVEEGANLPIVYGFIDLGLDTQYLRIEKSFAGEDINAYEAAQVEDSIYFQNVDVSLVNGRTGSEYILERIDANQIGFQREEGDFLRDPNYVYRVIASQTDLEGGDEIELRINRGDNSAIVSSKTLLLDSIGLSQPTVDRPDNFPVKNNKAFTLRLSDEVALVGINMIMYVKETDMTDPTQSEIVEIEWRIFNGKEREDNNAFIALQTPGRLFYTTLVDRLDANKQVFREFVGYDLILQGGGQEMVEYRRIERANSGLTGAQELPLYSNIDGGVGIFSSKYTNRINGFTLNPQARDSLANGSITGDLNFIF